MDTKTNEAQGSAGIGNLTPTSLLLFLIGCVSPPHRTPFQFTACHMVRILFPTVLCCVSMPTHNPRGIGGISSWQVGQSNCGGSSIWFNIRNSTLSLLMTKHKCHTTTKLSGLDSSNIKSVDFMGPKYASCSYGCSTEGQSTLMLAALLGLLVLKKGISRCQVSRMHPQSVLFTTELNPMTSSIANVPPLPVVDAARDYIRSDKRSPRNSRGPFLRSEATQLCHAFLYLLSMC